MEWCVVATCSALRNIYLMSLKNRETTAACVRDVVPLRKRLLPARARRTTDLLAVTIRQRRSYREEVISEPAGGGFVIPLSLRTLRLGGPANVDRFRAASERAALPRHPRRACRYADLHGKRAAA